jgi:hypothetical protein
MVGPGEPATMKWNVLEAQINYQSSEPSHHSLIIVVVVLIFYFINQVEVTCYDPRLRVADLMSLSPCKNWILSSLACGP